MNNLISDLIIYHKTSLTTHPNCNKAKGKYRRIGKRRKN